MGDLPALTERNDDDAYDRLSLRWTAGLFALFVIIVSTSNFVGDPIHCWVPAYFHGSWEKYVDSYCWVRNTYYYPFQEDIPRDHTEREKHPIIYYQWVPLILMVQGLFFYLPIVFWRNLNTTTGIDVNDIVETAEKVEKAEDLDERSKLLRLLAAQMKRSLRILKNPHVLPGKYTLKSFIRSCCGVCHSRGGSFLTVLYLFIKLIFVANAVGQLWLTNAFLGPWQYEYYGFHVIQAMYNGVDWTQSPRFPRVTLCDLDVRRLGNNHKYTVQCVLTINLFNEKIYLFLWFWMVMVAFISAFGFIMWFASTFVFKDDFKYVYKYLCLPNHLFIPTHKADRAMLHHFLDEYLRRDGVLVVRLIDYNTNKITMSNFLSMLYEDWITKDKIMKLREDEHHKHKEEMPEEEEPFMKISSS